MKEWSRAILLLLSVLFVSAVAAETSAAEAPRMPKEELKAKLGTSDLIIIDVRAMTDWLFTKEKIKGATREDPRKVEEWINKYPKDKTIVLYCA
jgi:rhodanese-related sulfurtransferase